MTLTPKPQPKSSFLQEESCSNNREHRRHQHHGKKEHKRKKRRRENLHGGFLKGKESIACKLQLRAHYNNSKQGRENLCQITSSSVGSSRKKIRHLQQIIRLQQQQRRQNKLKKESGGGGSIPHSLASPSSLAQDTDHGGPLSRMDARISPFCFILSLSLSLSLPQTFKRSNVVCSCVKWSCVGTRELAFRDLNSRSSLGDDAACCSSLWTLDTNGTPDFPLA